MQKYQSRRKNQARGATMRQQSDVASYHAPLPIDALSAIYNPSSTDPTIASPALSDRSTDTLRNALRQRVIDRFGGATPESPSLTEIGAKTGSPDIEPLGGAKRPQSMNRFGADFNNPRAEAEADRIGSQFSNISSFDSLKEKMGEKLNADFSGVRLHHDAHSIEMNQGAHAKAFTSGKDIYMGSGGFDSSIAAHEMVHTMQQGAVTSTTTTVMDAPSGSVQYVSETTRRTWMQAANEKKDRRHLDKLMETAPREVENLTASEGERIQRYLTDNNALDTSNKTRSELRDLTNDLASNTTTLMDPVMRMGLEQNTNIPQVTRDMLGDEMDHRVIADSMKKVNAANPNNLSNNEIENAEQAGRDMAHLMLAMQLGKFTVQDERGNSQTLQELQNTKGYMPSMAAMISHGGRIKMDFGTSTDSASAYDVYRSMMGLDGESPARDEIAHRVKSKRMAGTHYLESSANGLQEEKGINAGRKAMFDSRTRQRSFNPAIGGAGNVGIVSGGDEGHIIKPDGRNGHMFVGSKDSTADEHGGMLFGLETCGALQTSQTGKFHSPTGSSSPFSPVGGTKAGRIGGDKDGRSVDLSQLSMDEQIWLQHRLSQRMDALYNQPNSTEYDSMMEKLSGEQMTPEALAAMLCPMGADDRHYNDVLELVRKGRQILPPPPQA